MLDTKYLAIFNSKVEKCRWILLNMIWKLSNSRFKQQVRLSRMVTTFNWQVFSSYDAIQLNGHVDLDRLEKRARAPASQLNKTGYQPREWLGIGQNGLVNRLEFGNLDLVKIISLRSTISFRVKLDIFKIQKKLYAFQYTLEPGYSKEKCLLMLVF